MCPNTEAIDALSVSWNNGNHYVAPPTHLVIKVLKHMEKCKAYGTLFIPRWYSAAFWPYITTEGEFNFFVKDYRTYSNRQRKCVNVRNTKGMEALLKEETKFIALDIVF